MFDNILRDIKTGGRALSKNPRFSLMIVTMFALGIGAATTVFSAVNSLLIMPVPGYREGDRVVHVMATYPGENGRRSFLSVADYDELNRLNSIFDEVGIYQVGISGTFGERERAERLTGIQVSANILSILGSHTVIGRSFSPDESASGNNNVAIISYRIWKKYFGGSDDALGKTVTLGNNQYVVVGVTPEEFKIPGFNADFLSPLALSQASKSSHDKQIIARLASTSSINDASIRLNSLWPDLPGHSAQTKRHKFLLRSLREFYLGDLRATVTLVFAAVIFVLLFMCINISNLYVANGVRRQREFAIMSALGISKIAFVRKLLIESTLIAVIGGCCGMVVAWFGVKAFRLAPIIALLELSEIKIDGYVLLFALIISTLSGILSGIFPSIWFSGINISSSLNNGFANVQGGFILSPRRTPGILIGLQIAAASALLICSFLLAGSLYNLTRVDTGFNGRNLLTFWVSVPSNKYSSDIQRGTISQDVLDGIKQVTGVQSACMTSYPLFSGGMSAEMTLAQSTPNDSFEVQYREISPDYFRTLGITPLHGRHFDRHDIDSAQPVVIINDALRRIISPDSDPLGKQVRVNWGEEWNEDRTIVGVVKSVRDIDLRRSPEPTVYVPIRAHAYVVIRTAGEPLNYLPSLRAKIWEVDKNIPLSMVKTVTEMYADKFADPGFRAGMFGSFAVLALILAIVGVYGLVSFYVESRRKDIGIRMALGASPGNIIGQVIFRWMTPTFVGLVCGFMTALWLTGFLSAKLYGISPLDFRSHIGTAILIVISALLACFIPARGIVRSDLAKTLRAE